MNLESIDGERSKENTEETVQIQINERKLLRKIDVNVVPFVVLFYLLSFLDRTNIGNALISGLTKDLHLSDYQYRISLTLFYIPYIIFEVPSNLLVKKVGPNVWLPLQAIIWGIVATLQGIVMNTQGLWADRFFLGLTEAGMLPGILVYLSGWYTPQELQFRLAIFWSSASLAGAFAGLLAAAIGLMNGVGGLHGWSWIFILEGIITVLIGALGLILMPSFVSKARFLTPEERTFVSKRLTDATRAPDEEKEKFRWSEVFSVFTSIHAYPFLILSFCSGITIFGVAYFLPTIISTFGYSVWVTQLLTVPPYFFAFILTLIFAHWSDRTGQQSPFIILPRLLAIAGVAILYTCTRDHRSVGPRYFAVFLVVGGIYSEVPARFTWISNSFAPHYRRATALGCISFVSSMGALASTWLFRTADSPVYNTGYIVILSLLALGTVIPFLLRYYFVYVNKQRQDRTMNTVEESHERNQNIGEKGDRSDYFRYRI